jgi:hypothetical protein
MYIILTTFLHLILKGVAKEKRVSAIMYSGHPCPVIVQSAPKTKRQKAKGKRQKAEGRRQKKA